MRPAASRIDYPPVSVHRELPIPPEPDLEPHLEPHLDLSSKLRAEIDRLGDEFLAGFYEFEVARNPRMESLSI